MRTVSAAIVHLACLSALLCSSSAAQNLPIEERGLKPYGSYEGGNLDSINMANGSLTLHIPFWSYPQRGGKLRLNYFINFTTSDMPDQQLNGLPAQLDVHRVKPVFPRYKAQLEAQGREDLVNVE